MSEIAKVVAERVERARRDLLDLTLRNPLLNYRPRRASGVDAVDETAADVFDALVKARAKASFLPKPDGGGPRSRARGRWETAWYGVRKRETRSRARGRAARQALRLRTGESPRDLEARLLRTANLARTSIEEQGVNTLFFALGMVEWYESDASDAPRKAPLILVPVTLARGDVSAEFLAEYDDGDVGVNLSFIEKVKADFGVDIPDIPEDADADETDAAAYFAEVAAAVDNMPRWSVDESAVALGFFSFQKLLMYHDLDPREWGANGGLAGERVITAVFGGGGFSDPGPAVAEGERLDDHLRPQDLRHVLDADSSQASVIADVSKGRDLVVQGPPGTGKSQTIVNLIADAIGAGKTVLFVSEKMAALEVVKRRLDDIGIGDACLELHSHKTSKRAFLDELKRVSTLGKPITEGIQENLDDLERTRDELNAYAEAMNVEVGETGVTPHQAMGWTALFDRQIESGGDMPAPNIEGVDSWSRSDFARKRALTERLRRRLSGVGVPSEHPFWGTRIAEPIIPRRRRELESAVRAAADGASALSDASAALSQALRLRTPAKPSDADRAVSVAESVIPNADLARLNMRYPHWEKRREDIKALARAVELLHWLRAEYGGVLTPKAWEMDVGALENVKQSLGYGVSAFLRSFGFRPSDGVERARAIIGELWQVGVPDDALRAAIAREEIADKYDGVLLSSAWEVDEAELRGMRCAVSESVNSFWGKIGMRSKGFKNARTRMAGLWGAALPDDEDAWIAAMDALIEARTLSAKMSDEGAAIAEWTTAINAAIDAHRLASQIADLQDAGEGVFGCAWTGDARQWSAAAPLARKFLDLLDEIQNNRVPPETLHSLQWLAETGDLSQIERALAGTRAALPEYRATVAALHAALDMDVRARFGTDEGIAALPFAEQREILDEWANRMPELNDLIGFNSEVAQARAEGLGELVEIAQNRSGASEHLTNILNRARHESIIERAYAERPEIGGFDFAIHSDAIRRFIERDRDSLIDNRSRVASTHYDRLPDRFAGGEVAILRREFEKRRRHMPIRKLMLAAGNAVQGVKPVFMMSPLSIANYVPPGSLKFDVVIFDEASQVKPVDALGALMRGKQAVVVGDTQQLPPTSFFDRMGEGDDDGEDFVSADVESVLGLCRAQGIPVETLKWHYRSRHESLIALSNREFYGGDLVVFASPDFDRDQTGLRFRHLPNAVYENSRNRDEAKAVAKAVMEHAEKTPDMTLGAAAFSAKQAEAIQDELEILRRQDTSQEGFFNAHPHEPFFVKNLENVQGDERDVIFISVGYGRNRAGAVSMRFGPLNNEGGHRRLNVLITRARRRCEVFTNLQSQDIALDRTQSRGVAAFKAFLQYAETGVMPADAPSESGRDFGSPFQKALADSIRERGYEVHEEVASGGRFIDIAVVDPNRRGRYALGVEFDGAAYHSARWARDRDRLRDQVLEGLGWRLHRVWSTDYFANPEREVDKVEQAILRATSVSAQDANAPPTAARDGEDDNDPPPPAAESEPRPPEIERENAPTETDDRAALYETASPRIALGWYELHEVPYTYLIDAIEEIVRAESPIHQEEVARRIAAAVNIGRLGSRIRNTINREITASVRRGRVKKRGDFLWDPEMETPTVRNRDVLPAQRKKIELIAPEEIAEAVRIVVESAYTIRRDEAISKAAALLGFKRATANIQDRIRAVVSDRLSAGALASDGDSLRVGG